MYNKKPLVSFIIAAYNEELYIEECLRSCLDQTYQNIEICIVDDGSIDNTWKILKRFRDHRLSIYRFEKNRGKIAAFNKAFELSSGEYIAIMGADDISFPTRIENSLDNLDSHDLVFGDLSKFGREGLLSKSVMHEEYKISDNKIVTFSELLMRPIVYGGTIFATRKILKAIFPICEELSHEDWWIPLACAEKKPIKYIDSIMIKYRIHEAQTSGSNSITHSMSYNRWLHLETRDISFYKMIFSTFPLSRDEKCFVVRELTKKKMYLAHSINERLSILRASRGLISYLTNWKIFFILITGSFGSFVWYKIRKINNIKFNFYL